MTIKTQPCEKHRYGEPDQQGYVRCWDCGDIFNLADDNEDEDYEDYVNYGDDDDVPSNTSLEERKCAKCDCDVLVCTIWPDEEGQPHETGLFVEGDGFTEVVCNACFDELYEAGKVGFSAINGFYI